MTHIGEIIKSAREAKGITQAQLAEAIDSSVRTVIALEKEKRNPTMETLCRLIHTLDISADHFFYPEKAKLPLAQDQFIREFLACTDKEQRVLTEAARSILRAMREE